MKKQTEQELQQGLVSNRILITGIDGFTGQYLEQYFVQQGYLVFGTTTNPNNETKNHFYCDIRCFEDVLRIIARTQPDYIFHLAGISFVGETNRSLFYDVNVVGTEHLLEAVITEGIKPEKIIVASSATVYGNHEATVLDELICPKPINHYGYSKLAMEHLVSTYFQRLDIIVTRPFNYTGVRQSDNFFIPKIVSHYKQNKKIIELGNINVAREFNHISDVCLVYERLMLSSAYSTIVNICSGNPVYLKDVIKILDCYAGYKMELKVNESFVRKNEIPILSGSIQKLMSLIDYKFKYSIEQTLKEMYVG